MNKSVIEISGRKVGESEPVLIIAEAGINHDGKFEQAIALIDAAAEAKADVVKFQLFTAKKMYSRKAGQLSTANGNNVSIVDTLKDVELPTEWIPKLIDRCEEKGIGFLCTVCDEESCDALDSFNVDSFKMASYGINHIPLMDHVASKNKTIVFSTAGATLSDAELALNTIRKHHSKVAMLHCVAKYPAPLNSCNMNVLKTFKLAFPDIVIGYSDHTENPVKAPIAAVKNGAKIIEKHFTVDKTLPGPDHCFAVDPIELKDMVNAIRDTEKKLLKGEQIFVDDEINGSSEKRILEIEEYARGFAYRCLIATKDLSKGEEFTTDNVAVLRPGENNRGIHPKYKNMICNKGIKSNKDIEAGDSVTWDYVLNK